MQAPASHTQLLQVISLKLYVVYAGDRELQAFHRSWTAIVGKVVEEQF